MKSTTHQELLSQLEEIADIAKEDFKLEFSKTPLSKNVLTILGDQSSGNILHIIFEKKILKVIQQIYSSNTIKGKSSFINHLFGIPIRETGSNAIDTQFTIIETVPDEEFQELTSGLKNEKIEYDDLLEPIQRTKTDKRKNVVCNEIVNAIVINEKYIIGTPFEEKLKNSKKKSEEKKVQPKEKNLTEYFNPWTSSKILENNEPVVKSLIIIDTPGFNDESMTDPQKFKANIDVLEFFFTQSSLVLFLVSTDHMLSIGCSLHMLQLTLLDQDTKKLMYEQAIKEINGSKGPGFVESLLTGAYSMMEERVKGLLPNGYSNESGVKHHFFGASMYEKLYFVINKIDLCKKPNTAFFEFGCSIGRKFKYLPLPTSSHVLGIGIPQEQKVKYENDDKKLSFGRVSNSIENY
eukprot:gene3954-7210_t